MTHRWGRKPVQSRRLDLGSYPVPPPPDAASLPPLPCSDVYGDSAVAAMAHLVTRLKEDTVAGPRKPDGQWAAGDEALEQAGYAAGLDVWDQVAKAYENDLGDSGLANAQLWSLKQAVIAEYEASRGTIPPA
jgi:hypothetical protein